MSPFLSHSFVQTIKTFGTNHFYSADVFNELTPQTTLAFLDVFLSAIDRVLSFFTGNPNGFIFRSDLNYLAQINSAIYQSIANVDPDAVW